MEPNQILVIGDSSFDVFLTPRSSEIVCKSQKNTKYICFPYGNKIPVDEIAYYPGGNAANIAIGLQRLGLSVSLSTYFSDDSLGQLLKNHLEQNHLDLSLSTIDNNSQCNYATIITYNNERTIFTYHTPRTYRFPFSIPAYQYVYVTSMGKGYESYFRDFITWAITHKETNVCFNPGSIQLYGDKDLLTNLFTVVSYLFINRSEAEYFTNMTDTNGKEVDILTAPVFKHISTVIMTDGTNGSFIKHNDKYYKAGCYPTIVKEKTGAGDAYNAGFMAGILKRMNIIECIQLATINAALVIHSIGAQEGLLKEADIKTYLSNAKTLLSVEQIF